MRKSRQLILFTFLFTVAFSGIIVASFALKTSMDTRSRAEDITPTPVVPDCAKDPNNPDYCGEDRPFRGCNGGGEWLCQCRKPDGHWWSECSVVEDTEGKQKYRDKCGGDDGKALLQWKYDVALGETGGQCSCGGQNVCGSLIPTRPAGGGGGAGGFPPGEKPPPLASPVIDTPIPTPTLAYRLRTGDGGVVPTAVFIPPTNAPFYIQPTGIYQSPGTIPDQTPTPTPILKPLVNIDIKGNIQAVSDFVAKTQKTLADFFSKVLP